MTRVVARADSVPRHAAAGRNPRRRLLARARGAARGDAARRPRGRRDQGRAPRRGRRHPRLGPAVARRRVDLLPGAEPQQALDRAGPQGSEEDLALARELASRADVMIESFRPGLIAELGLAPDALPRGQPGPGVVLGDRVRERRGGRRAAGLRLPAAGDGRADVGHGRAGRAAAEGRHGGGRSGVRAARGERHPGGAGGARAHGRRAPRRGVVDGLRADDPAEPGDRVGGGGRERAGGAGTATRASSRTRPTRPPTASSRSRSATSASSCGCARRSGWPSCRPTRVRVQRGAGGARRRARGRRSRRCCATQPAEHWLERAARGEGARPGRSTASTRRSPTPRSSAWSRSRRSTGCR